MKFLILFLSAFLLLFVVRCTPDVSSENDMGLSKFFISTLKESMKNADLVAQIEITGFELEKKDKNLYLYRFESKALEVFKGQSLKNIRFHQWMDEDLSKEKVIGARMIVTLYKSAHDAAYFAPEDGYAFPDDADLLAVARKAAAAFVQK